jgi:hypothetical protein
MKKLLVKEEKGQEGWPKKLKKDINVLIKNALNFTDQTFR